MRPGARLALFATIGLGAITLAPVARGDEPGRPVSLVKMPYRGERNLADLSDSPDYLDKGGLQKLFEQQGWRLRWPRRRRATWTATADRARPPTT